MNRNILFLTILALVALAGVTSAKDVITKIELDVLPASAKIRPNETAIIRAEFFGKKKKKGLFGSIFGNNANNTSKVQSNDWKVALKTKDSGWISKPFLFQEAGEKPATGLENLIKKSLNVASSKDAILYTAPAKEGKYTIKITEGNLSKEISIFVSDSVPTSKESEVFIATRILSSGKYADLVEHYAPFIAQETWFDPKADYLAHFNYDGNWKGEDNWENLKKGSSQAAVYYDVIETETHWFLQYSFFHPRDYSDVCIAGTCHENDFEGLILTVRKNETTFGKLEVMETLAHNNIYSFTNDPSIKNGVHNIDGKIDLHEGVRPIVFIEAGGHGVFGSSYKTSLFDAQKMDFKQNTGVTYIRQGKYVKPRHANDRDVGYILLPSYSELWLKGTQETSSISETFDNFFSYQPFANRPKTKANLIAGAFRGKTIEENMAKPFWAWHDKRTRNRKILNTGQWALDPAYSVSQNLTFPSSKPFSTTYTFNPYLETEGNKLP